jgi:hypothetical protein
MESTIVMVPRGMELGRIERFLYAGLVVAKQVGEGWLADRERRFDGFCCVASHDRIALLNHPPGKHPCSNFGTHRSDSKNILPRILEVLDDALKDFQRHLQQSFVRRKSLQLLEDGL